jgi:hypothetical protein
MKANINSRKDYIEYHTDTGQLLISLYLYSDHTTWEVGSYGTPNSFKLDDLQAFAVDLLAATHAASLVISSGELPQ